MVKKTTVAKKQGLLPTPPIPAGLPGVDLTDNSRQVLKRRYLRRGENGQPIETIEEMFWRVSYNVATAEEKWGMDLPERAIEFYHLLSSKKFFPNSPTFTGAGTPLGQLAACFVLPVNDDMGRDSAGIFQSLRDAALIQQTGGGNGFSFSRLRPTGSMVNTSAGQATGPIGFLRVYDNAFGEIAQGGCLLPETLVFTDKGLLRLDELVSVQKKGWQSHQISVPTDEGMRPSPRGYNNGVADVLRVHTREGVSLTGTPNHRVKVMTDEGPFWNQLEDLSAGDWILMKLGEHRGKMQVLSKPKKQHGNQIMPTLPSVLDEEFAFFLGYFAGDGFFAQKEQDHRIGVSVAHTSYLMEAMPEMLSRLFGVQVHRQQKENDRSVTFVIDNRAVKEFFSFNGFDKALSRNVSVPRKIRQSSPEIVGAYLRGLFEADGTLTHGYPTLTTSSSRLAREVSTLLIGLGSPVKIRTIASGLERYGNSERHEVKITSSIGLEIWRKKIGSEKRSRFVEVYAWEADQRRESSYVLPNPQYWLEPVLEEITLTQVDPQGRGGNIKFRSTDSALRKRLLRYTRGERNLTRSAYETLKKEHDDFAQNAPSVDGFWFIQVAGVEDAGESLTFDLEVDENHTYLAYGMVTHNTRRGANMGVLRVDHPDIADFITCKTNENQITNFNISVGITDAFMHAVEKNEEWALRFPDVLSPKYRGFKGTLEQAEAAGIPIRTYEKVNARELYEKIVKQAHHNGEPGMLFLDAANRDNPVPHLYALESTNPCVTGETLIYTENGLQRADILAQDDCPLRIATDGRFQKETILAASHVFETGIKDIYRLITREGYELRLTANHRVMTERGWVEAQELVADDKVHIFNRKGGFSKIGTLEEGRILGWLVGDGTISAISAILSFFGDEKGELAPIFAEMITNLVDKPAEQHRAYPVGVINIIGRDEARVSSERLRHWAESYGLVDNKFIVPDGVFMGSEEMQRGFLQALFTADGQVNDGGEKGCSVRLSSSHLPLLNDVQKLLLNFGIASKIYQERRAAGYRNLPDGKGGLKAYFCQSQHDLAISKTNLIAFANEIGFLMPVKQDKVVDYLSRMKRGPYKETFIATVLAVEPDGKEMVYDLNQPETHSFIANGLVVHNCGEQWLGPYESCCLGSINLAEHCDLDGEVDWEEIRKSTVLSTYFLDDVVDINAYVPAVPQLKEAAQNARRIGLGIMGLADLMYHVGARYGSQDGQEFSAQVLEFVRYHAMQTSIKMAEERAPFTSIEGSIYDPANLTWEKPRSVVEYTQDWGRPDLDWDSVVDGLRAHGIRNAAQTTIAPTGTIATVAGCEGYGCEPTFALAYIRHVDDNGKDLQLAYTSPRFDAALSAAGLAGEARQEIYEQVMEVGSCQNIEDIPTQIRDTFVVSGDITADEHVRMQAAMQAFVDNSLSKTVNFPATATQEDVSKAYILAWELGCKGITVYVTGSRDKVVLETKATAKVKHTEGETLEKPLWGAGKKPRPRSLLGWTYNVNTPLGKAFVTVNENGGRQPFEVFVNTAKAGSETAAVSEAIGRLLSYILRLASPVSPRDRIKEIVRQLGGIGGGRSLGFGAKRVRSLPDGVGQVLTEYLREADEHLGEWVPAEVDTAPSNGGLEVPRPNRIGDLCPECGEAAVINEEGCRKCYACAFSEC